MLQAQSIAHENKKNHITNLKNIEFKASSQWGGDRIIDSEFIAPLLWNLSNKIIRGKYEFFGTGNESKDWLEEKLSECDNENCI